MTIDFIDIDVNNKLIDVRNRNDFNNKSIPGSINVPRIELLSNPDNYINKNEIVYLVCDKGKVSLSCCKILDSLGYHCYSVEGGIEKILN